MDNLDTKTKLGTRHRSKKKKQLKETKMMSNIKWPHQKQVVNSGAREVPVSYKAPGLLQNNISDLVHNHPFNLLQL
jgi:hypothetical protein